MSLPFWILATFPYHFYLVTFVVTITTHLHWFGFDDNLYYIYSTDLWRDASIFGNNSSWIFAATIDNSESRSVDCWKPKCSKVLFLPSSFNIPSSQQIWSCLTCSDESRGEIKNLKILNKWNGQLSMLTLILDSGANLYLFNMLYIPSRSVIKKEVYLLNLAISHYQRMTIIILLTVWLIFYHWHSSPKPIMYTWI